jgi:hypothetical protein
MHAATDILSCYFYPYSSYIFAISVTIASEHIGFLAGYMQAITVVQRTVEGLLWNVSNLYQYNLFEFLDVVPHKIASGKRAVSVFRLQVAGYVNP